MRLLPTAMTLLMALIFFVSIGPELAKDIHSDINPLNYASNNNNSLAIFLCFLCRGNECNTVLGTMNFPLLLLNFVWRASYNL